MPDLALKQNKEVSPGNTAPKGEVTPALETKATTLVPSVASEPTLQAPPPSHPISDTIAQHAARKVDQSLEQQLYSSVWGGVAAAIIKTATVNTTAESRRAIDELQQLLVVSDARDRKRKGSNIWDRSFFRSIATIIGPEAAETVTKKIEHFSKQTNNSPAAVNQLVKDIAAALTTGDSIQRLNIATEIVENAIASEIKARLAVEAIFPAKLELSKEAIVSADLSAIASLKGRLCDAYERLGATVARTAVCQKCIDSKSLSDAEKAPYRDLLKNIAKEKEGINTELKLLMSNKETLLISTGSPEIRDLISNLPGLRADLQAGQEKLKAMQANAPERTEMATSIQELQLEITRQEESRAPLMKTPEIESLLKNNPNFLQLVQERGLHPLLAKKLIEGQRQALGLLEQAKTIDLTALPVASFVDNLALARLSPAALALFEHQFAVNNKGKKLEDFLQEHYAKQLKIPLEDFKKDSVSNDLHQNLELLRAGKNYEFVANSLLRLASDTKRESYVVAREALHLFQHMDPSFEAEVLKELHKQDKVGNSGSQSLASWFVGHSDPIRTREGKENTSTRYLVEYREAQAAASRPEATHQDQARLAAIVIRFELYERSPSGDTLKNILLHPPTAFGASITDATDAEMKDWAKLVANAWQKQDLGEWGDGRESLDKVLNYQKQPAQMGLALLVQGQVSEAKEVFQRLAQVNDKAIDETITYEAIQYARIRGELTGLIELETIPERKQALQQRLAEEEKKIEQLRANPELAKFSTFSSTNQDALQQQPLEAEFLNARERVRQVAQEVAAYPQLVKDGKLDVDTVLEDLSRRFSTPEAGAIFKKTFEDTHKQNLIDFLTTVDGVPGSWDKMSLENRKSYRENTSQNKERWDLREQALCTALQGDRVGFVVASTEILLIQGNGPAFQRLQNLYSTMPAMAAEIDERLKATGSSLEALVTRRASSSAYSPSLITSRDIGVWLLAKAGRAGVRADAVELRALMMTTSGQGNARALDAQPLIKFLTRDGFGSAAAVRLECIKNEFRQLYGKDANISAAFEERAKAGGAAPTWSNDYGTISSFLKGDLRAAEKSAVERAFYLRSNFEPKDGVSYNVVMADELNRLVKIIPQERFKEIKGEIDTEISKVKFWSDRGVTTLDGYIAKCGGPDFGQSSVDLVDKIVKSGGLPEQVLEKYKAIESALKGGLQQTDSVRKDIQQSSSTFASSTLVGALNNAQSSQKAYYDSGGPIQWTMGHTEALRGIAEKDKLTFEQALLLSTKMQNGLKAYGTVDYEFKNNVWSVKTGALPQGSRHQIVVAGRDALSQLLEGNIDGSDKQFNVAVNGIKNQFDRGKPGLSSCIAEKDTFFKDASSRIRESQLAFDAVIANCDTTITVLKTTRTVVLVGGAIVATGGLGAGVLITTVSIGGIAFVSHGVEGVGYYAYGLKDGNTAAWDALINGAEDANNVWMAAGLGGLARGLSTLPSNARLAYSAIREIGVRRYLSTKVVYLVPQEGGQIFRKALIERTKSSVAAANKVLKNKDVPTNIEAMGTFVGKIQRLAEIPVGTTTKWVRGTSGSWGWAPESAQIVNKLVPYSLEKPAPDPEKDEKSPVRPQINPGPHKPEASTHYDIDNFFEGMKKWKLTDLFVSRTLPGGAPAIPPTQPPIQPSPGAPPKDSGGAPGPSKPGVGSTPILNDVNKGNNSYVIAVNKAVQGARVAAEKTRKQIVDGGNNLRELATRTVHLVGDALKAQAAQSTAANNSVAELDVQGKALGDSAKTQANIVFNEVRKLGDNLKGSVISTAEENKLINGIKILKAASAELEKTHQVFLKDFKPLTDAELNLLPQEVRDAFKTRQEAILAETAKSIALQEQLLTVRGQELANALQTAQEARVAAEKTEQQIVAAGKNLLELAPANVNLVGDALAKAQAAAPLASNIDPARSHQNSQQFVRMREEQPVQVASTTTVSFKNQTTQAPEQIGNWQTPQLANQSSSITTARVLSLKEQQTVVAEQLRTEQIISESMRSAQEPQIGSRVALIGAAQMDQRLASSTGLTNSLQQSQEPLRLRESAATKDTATDRVYVEAAVMPPAASSERQFSRSVALKSQVGVGVADYDEKLVSTNLVTKERTQQAGVPQGPEQLAKQLKERETATAASAEQEKLASVSKQASALNIRVEQAAEVETVQVLSLKEQQTVIAEQLLTEQIISESIHRAQELQLLSQIEKVQAAAALVTAQSLITAPLKGSLATPLMAEATPFLEVTPFLEATPDYEPLFSSNESDPAPVRKVQRKIKSSKGQDRLRDIVMQQLLTLNFNQSRKSDLLKLLITLGISEKEYRELVAKVGEAEARSMAAKAEGREKVARRIEAPLESAKEPVRLKGEVKPATAKISRAELYVRMKQ